MTPNTWNRVAEIAGQALEQPPAKRQEFVHAQCGGDRALYDAVMDMLRAADEMGGEFLAGTPQLEPIEEEFGRYRAIREIGHGGMSLVYLGERVQSEFQQRVAIKVILHKSPGVLQESETQILARLEHPNIARFLDAGTTKSGLHYLVMEFIDGVPCTEFCRDLPDERAKLRVFLDVCAGVQYANRSLVVHRDLKPGNVMVDRTGTVKLLDFGIAKILTPEPSAQTVGTRAYTPDYASPEQILGDPVTTATDVYSLGVILCELVGGKRPRVVADLPMADVVALARTEVGQVPLTGDLAIIARKALRVDPLERYASAGELARDVERYLEGRPIEARPQTWVYKAKKFLARNRFPVAVAASVGFALAAAAGVAFWQARIAAQRFDQLRELSKSVLYDLHDAIEPLPGSLKARKLLVEKSIVYLDKLSESSSNNTELEIEVLEGYMQLAKIEGPDSIGDVNAAKQHVDKGLAIARRLAEREPRRLDVRRQLFLTLDNTGSFYNSQGLRDQSIALTEECVRVASETLRLFPEDMDARRDHARSHYVLGFTYLRSRDHQERGLSEMKAALEAWKSIAAGAPDDEITLEELAKSNNSLGAVSFQAKDYAQAAAYYGEALRLNRIIRGRSPRKEEPLAFALGQVAIVASVRKDFAEALKMFGEQLELRKAIHERQPAQTEGMRRLGVSYNRICDTYNRAKNPDEAIKYGEQAVALQRKVYKLEPTGVLANREYLYALVDLALAYGKKDQPAKYCPLMYEAEPLLTGPLERINETIGDRTRKSDVRMTLPRCRARGILK